MKPVNKTRSLLLATLIAGSTVGLTGCSSGTGFSLASMNPFSRPKPNPVEESGAKAGMSESIASMTNSAKSGVTAIGASARTAVGKTTSAVTGVFRKPTDPASSSDPLSLSNKPETVNAEVYVANGQLWESSGDMTKARESYDNALKSEPNNAQALVSIARLNYREGKYQEASEFFRRALTVSPNDAELHNDIALTQSKLNDVAGSIASFEKALKLAPGTSRYANNLATVHYESGDAAAAYRVLVTNNKPAVAHFNMAYLHYKSGNLEEAKKHLNAAAQYEPESSSDAIVNRAVTRSKEMLAQINTAASPVAQAAPQATIAGGQFFNGRESSPVQQTAQSEVAAATGAVNTKAAPTAGPATQAITPPAATNVSLSPGAVMGADTSLPASWMQQTTTAPAVQPSQSKPGSSTDAAGPSFPFSLPSSFDAAE